MNPAPSPESSVTLAICTECGIGNFTTHATDPNLYTCTECGEDLHNSDVCTEWNQHIVITAAGLLASVQTAD